MKDKPRIITGALVVGGAFFVTTSGWTFPDNDHKGRELVGILQITASMSAKIQPLSWAHSQGSRRH